MQSLDSFVFFNRGFHSGMSIIHKHFQAIPYESMGESGSLPVEDCILAEFAGESNGGNDENGQDDDVYR